MSRMGHGTIAIVIHKIVYVVLPVYEKSSALFLQTVLILLKLFLK